MSASEHAAPHPEHGHGHGHGPAQPVSSRVRILLSALLIPLAIAAVIGAIILYPFTAQQATGNDLGLNREPVHAQVTAVRTSPCGGTQEGSSPNSTCQTVTVLLADGPGSGATIDTMVPAGPSTPRFAVNDAVVLAFSGEGNPRDGAAYELVDYQRGLPLSVLAAVFAVAVIILARWRGLAALGALVISFAVLMFFVLPAILAGQNPLWVAVAGAGIIMFLALYLTHGFSARTSTAVLGTMVSLVLIGLLAWGFAVFAKLTGFDEGSANLVSLLGRGIDTRGLLLAGIIIGALGVLDDVTVTQASAVWELRRANPALSWRALYSAGLRIGRDHVGSAVNTLFMAYAGASFPLLLAYSISGRGFADIVTAQSVAQEVVRTLVGSIGLIAAVPVTTVLAALIAVREPVLAQPEFFLRQNSKTTPRGKARHRAR